jgi:hypothetical protein
VQLPDAVIEENVLSTPGAWSRAVLLPVPVVVTLGSVPLLGPSVDVTDTHWLRVELRLIVAPVSTPMLLSNFGIALVPRLVLALLFAPPPSESVRVAEFENMTDSTVL